MKQGRRVIRAAVTALIAVTVGAASLSACGSDDSEPASSSTARTTPNAYEAQRSEGAQRLLDKLSKALSAGDTRGVDALIDPAAEASFRRGLATQAANLAPSKTTDARGGQLKLKSFALKLTPQSGPEWQIPDALQSTLTAAGSSDVWVTPIETVYALGGTGVPGLDEPEVTLSGMLTLARYDDDWKVVGSGDLAPDPLSEGDPRPSADAAPWDFAGLRAADVPTGGGTSVVLSYPSTDAIVGKLTRLLPGAVAAVNAFWGDDWARRSAMVATGSVDQFTSFTRTQASSVEAAAAATVFGSSDLSARIVTGQRIVFAPTASQLSAGALAVVLRHELVHVASRLDTSADAPLWLTEGVPEYVGRKGTYKNLTDAAPELAAEVAARRVPTAFPTDKAFSVSTDASRLAYQTAWSLSAFIAEKFGEPKLKSLYLAVAKGNDSKADAAISSTLGVDRGELIKEWQSWLRTQVR